MPGFAERRGMQLVGMTESSQHPIQDRIRAELSAIERGHAVSILIAVESGSRAWGFPSRDSDYDVRFIYLHQAEHYLTVFPRRDVIERPVDAVLDISGWDIRKALQLLLGSNAALHEWVSSPVRYIDDATVAGQLRGLIEAGADLRSFEYHYDRLARRSFDEISSAGGAVRLKSYCYALRAVLSLRWLRDRRTPPPMDLPSLLAGLDLPARLIAVISDLVERKALATERDTAAPIAELEQFIDQVLARGVTEAGGTIRPDIRGRADAMFAAMVLDRVRAGQA